ncbi:MAG: class I SAM-dependent methyltransferase [Kangiellaceae bacterium]|nr:class I SAM-dependent methyltransferase [Kangiellaceae bacterium]
MSNKLEHWSKYWETGSITSLPQDFSENYDGELKAFWNDRFSQLKSNSSVLDLCTGNGAIALLAQNYSDSKSLGFQVTGVDAAVVDKNKIKSRSDEIKKLISKIEIIDRTPVESLQLPSASFSMITSQYGIEYCEWDSVATIISDLLQQDGRLVLVCHSFQTAIEKYMQQEQAEFSLLKENGFFDCFEKLIQKKIEHADFVSQISEIFSSLSKNNMARQSRLIAGIANSVSAIVSMNAQVFQQNLDGIKRFYIDQLSAFLRLEDVLNVSKRIKEFPEWYRVFEKYGLVLEDKGKILQNESEYAGQYYSFVKR